MKIRKIIYFIGFIGCFSCKDFLEEKPIAQIGSEFFYDTDKDIDEAVNAVYSGIAANFNSRMPIFSEVRADLIKVGPSAQAATRLLFFENYSYNNLNTDIIDTWSTFYKAINDANVAIEKVPLAATAAEVHKKRVVGEAKFLRAFSYFNLVRLWGSVPLKLTSTTTINNLQIPKSSVEDIYNAIVNDLKYATGETSEYTGLPTSYAAADNGRITLGAANALMAEVYLTMKNYSLAAEYAKKVIDSKRYELWANYPDAFLWANKYKANTAPGGEAIFEIQFDHNAGLPSVIVRWTAPRNAEFTTVTSGRGGFGNIPATSAAYTMFSASDARRATIFPATYTNNKGAEVKLNTTTSDYFSMKYRLDGQVGAVFGNAANNWPIFRYADVLLIYAEALNEVGGPNDEAYAAINKIRKRAKLNDLTAGLDQTSFRDSLYAERAKELFLEGDRFFDLTRTGRFVSELSKAGVAVTEEQKFLPIPQSEIDLNPNLK